MTAVGLANLPQVATVDAKATEGMVYASTSALVATAGTSGEVRRATSGDTVAIFAWKTGNQSALVDLDPLGGVFIPPATDTTGASGAWQRQHVGIIRAEWFGADGGADDTDAIQACDELFRERDEFHTWLVSDIHTTFGIGDLNSKQTYATKADADADIGSHSDYDVITILADETQGGGKRRYRVKSGAYVGPLSTRQYNGKSIFATGAAKRNGFKLKAGAPSWMRLMGASVSDAIFKRVFFNGDNPSNQWGNGSAAQNNPNTELLVEIDGYGVSWHDCMVRFSGGDGVRFRGVIGQMEWSGGDCVSQYNIGWGVVIDRMSSWKATKMWVEGNDEGGILLKHDVLSTDDDFATATSFVKRSAIKIDSIYSENASNTAPTVEVQGGHFAPWIGDIAKHGTGVNRPDVLLKNNPDADDIYRGCHGGYFNLGGTVGANIICESESWGNTFERHGGFPTSAENDAWDVRDDGKDNVFIWSSVDATAFEPGGSTGDISVNGGSSSFVNNSSSSPAMTNAEGGILGPVQDYHPNFAGGPSYVEASNFNPEDGGAELNVTLSLNANLPATIKTWYAILVIEANAGQQVRLGLRDQTSGDFFNWSSENWTPVTTPDAFGVYRTLRVDHRAISYAVPFRNDGIARQIRPNVRMVGGGTAKLYHCFVTDNPRPALCAILFGQFMGTKDAPVCTDATQVPANLVPVGTQVFNITQTEMQISDGSAWIGAGLT